MNSESPYKLIAVWTEVRELEFASLDEAAVWARKLLGEQPDATIQVSARDFFGSWYTPREARKGVTQKQKLKV